MVLHLSKSLRVHAVLGSLMLLFVLTMPGLAQDVKITYSNWSSNPDIIRQTEAQLRQFEAQNPGVKVEFMPTTEGGTTAHANRMLAMMAGGVAPDLMMISRSDQFQFWVNDMLEPLTRYIESDPSIDWDDFLGQTQVTMNGDIWGLPEHGGGLTIRYNVGMIQEAGLADPWDLYQRGDWTLDAYLDDARRLTQDTNGDGTPDVFGSSHFRGTQQITALIASYGGQMFSDDGKKVRFGTPKAIDAMKWATDLESTYNVAGGSFDDETRAMSWICANCPFEYLATHRFDFDWNIVPPPRGPSGFRAPGGFNSLFVNSRSSHKKEAYTLAVFLTSKEIALQRVEQRAPFSPVRRSVLALADFREQYEPLHLEGWLLSATDYLTPVPSHVPDAWGLIGTLSKELARVVAGEDSLRNAVERSVDVAQARLDQAWAQLGGK